MEWGFIILKKEVLMFTYKAKIRLLISLQTLSLLVLYSCSTDSIPDTSETFKDTLQLGDVSGQLYFTASDIDSATCLATCYGDCCAGNILFINDSSFVGVDYCLGSDTYSKGTYLLNKNSILLYYDSIRVDKETNFEPESDTIKTSELAYIIKQRKAKAESYNWTRFDCKNKICFKSVSGGKIYATPNNENKNHFLTMLKQDSVWDKLQNN